MPKEIDYLFEIRKLLDENSRIIEAWLDDPHKPTELHICHKNTFNLHHCKMSQALASLKLVFHKAGLLRNPQTKESDHEPT